METGHSVTLEFASLDLAKSARAAAHVLGSTYGYKYKTKLDAYTCTLVVRRVS